MERNKIYISILPGLVVVIYFSLFVLFGQFLEIGKLSELKPNLALANGVVGTEIKGRYFWGISALMVTAALFWNLAISTLIYSRFTIDGNKITKLVPIAILSLSAIPIAMLAFGWSIPGEIVNNIHETIHENAKIDITIVLDSLNILAFIVILSLVSALGVLVTDQKQKKMPLSEIAARFEWANISLYSAAILLTVGVIEVYAQHSWAAAFLDGALKEAYSTTAGVLALSAGAVFSALLLILYTPVALVHRSWIVRELESAQKEKEDFDVDNWLKRHAIDKSILKSFSKFSSMVFPIIVGAAIKLLLKA